MWLPDEGRLISLPPSYTGTPVLSATSQASRWQRLLSVAPVYFKEK